MDREQIKLYQDITRRDFLVKEFFKAINQRQEQAISYYKNELDLHKDFEITQYSKIYKNEPLQFKIARIEKMYKDLLKGV